MPDKAYRRGAAVSYAHRWAFDRNPRYYNFDALGGDCTNFASQVIFAGAGRMNYLPTFGWYYHTANNRSPSWTGVEYLYQFLIKNEGPGPFAVETGPEDIAPGDVIQLSFDGSSFAHSPVVVKTGKPATPDNILVAAHTFNSDNRPLSSYAYKKTRFLHILGVRL